MSDPLERKAGSQATGLSRIALAFVCLRSTRLGGTAGCTTRGEWCPRGSEHTPRGAGGRGGARIARCVARHTINVWGHVLEVTLFAHVKEPIGHAARGARTDLRTCVLADAATGSTSNLSAIDPQQQPQQQPPRRQQQQQQSECNLKDCLCSYSASSGTNLKSSSLMLVRSGAETAACVPKRAAEDPA